MTEETSTPSGTSTDAEKGPRSGPVASVIHKDIFKQPVEPAQFVSPIPEGQYYLGLPHPRSFDSRVIGYVSAKDVRGVVWPIF